MKKRYIYTFVASLFLMVSGMLFAAETTHWTQPPTFLETQWGTDAMCEANNSTMECDARCADRDVFVQICLPGGTDNCVLDAVDYSGEWWGSYGCFEHYTSQMGFWCTCS